MLRYVALISLILLNSAFANENVELVKKVQGCYRYSFENAFVSGEKYIATDSLEIKPDTKDGVKFETTLNFFNGHTCYLEGTANYNGKSSFIYDDQKTATEDGCKFEIKLEGEKIIFVNHSYCSQACGARGGFGGEEGLQTNFKISQKTKLKPTEACDKQ